MPGNVCLFDSHFLDSLKRFFLLGRLDMLVVSFVKRTDDDPDVVCVGYVRFCMLV